MRLAFCLLSLVLAASGAQADSFPFATSDLEYPDFARRGSDKTRQEYCEAVLQELRQDAVQYYRPIYQAASIEELSRVPGIGKCKWTDFISTVAFEPRVWDTVRNLPTEERDKYGHKWTMSTGFGVYKVDIDNKASNGAELILYGAGTRDTVGNLASYSHFVVLNLKTCRPRYRAQVDDIDYFRDSKVGILRARQQALIFESHYYERQQQYTLRLLKLYYVPKRKDSLFGPACTFTAKARSNAR